MLKGTCLQTYIPIRSEPRSGAEMVSSLLFGENYIVIKEEIDWFQITTIFDNYTGWISKNTYDEFQEFDTICNAFFIVAKANDNKIYIPCGGLYPSSLSFKKNGTTYKVEQLLKPIHHLPLSIRLLKTAQQFLNTPYLWGGRSFMGIDCSGLVQVVFKANGINLLRDTSQQIQQGKEIELDKINTGDLVFFNSPNSTKVSHVGFMLNKTEVIHSSGFVKIQSLNPEGLYNENGELTHYLMAIKRLID